MIHCPQTHDLQANLVPRNHVPIMRGTISTIVIIVPWYGSLILVLFHTDGLKGDFRVACTHLHDCVSAKQVKEVSGLR